MKQGVLITGCKGGIGQKLVDTFASEDWAVVGVDKLGSASTENEDGSFIKADIAEFSSNASALSKFGGAVREYLGDVRLSAVINNAAVQHLGNLEHLSSSDIVSTMNVNVIAPMLIVKEFLSDLQESQGSIINVGSVHAQATKPEFSAYATSKAALHGLTRALAVDLGPSIRVNTVAPAATETDMLKAGFEGRDAAYEALKNAHPLQRIADPEEIARIALFLASSEAAFLTGATFFADGGVLSRLHDPV